MAEGAAVPCGHGRVAEVCSGIHNGAPRLGRHRRRIQSAACRARTCGTGWTGWQSRAAGLAAERGREGAALHARRGFRSPPLRHFALSPPASWTTRILDGGPADVRALRRAAEKLLTEHGLQGFMLVVHLYRSEVKSGANRYRAGKNYVSPHVHVIGHGRLTPAGDFYRMSGGWVYKNKGRRTSLAGTISYLLDHASVVKGLLTVTWHGTLATRRLRVIGEKRAFVPLSCPCGDELLHQALDVFGVPLQSDTWVGWTKIRKRQFEVVR